MASNKRVHSPNTSTETQTSKMRKTNINSYTHIFLKHKEEILKNENDFTCLIQNIVKDNKIKVINARQIKDGTLVKINED